jgi:hypothetical protein
MKYKMKMFAEKCKRKETQGTPYRNETDGLDVNTDNGW